MNPRTGLDLEQAVDALVSEVFPTELAATEWDAFIAWSDHIHTAFEVPGTTLTPAMRRLLFALARAHQPRRVAAVGSYVGYALSWLLVGHAGGQDLHQVLCVDPDADANHLAQRNLASLNLPCPVEIRMCTVLDLDLPSSRALDLVLLDLDDPLTGKMGYGEALAHLAPHLRQPALLVAHDMTAERFAGAAEYYLATLDQVLGDRQQTWLLPVDDCGVAVTRITS